MAGPDDENQQILRRVVFFRTAIMVNGKRFK
jgi:hypothetical protein